jgi:SAM-dependent methyltransferase
VYGPIAHELVRRSPHPLAGRSVHDAGAGTGAGSDALRAAGARPIAVDLSADMLRWDIAHRPPAVAASVEQLPIAPRSVDDVYASFVLNHLAQPAAAMRELADSARAGGAFLATAFATESVSAARDRIDDIARSRGWQPPEWYAQLKADVMPLLGTAAAMRAAADDAGLASVTVDEARVDVGVTRAAQLVDYRLGQAHVAAWLRTLGADTAEAVRAEAIAAVEPVMVPYRPIVVFLVAAIAG